VGRLYLMNDDFTQQLRKLGVKVEVSTKGTNRDKCVVYGYRFQKRPE
jgi:hypothetical protein